MGCEMTVGSGHALAGGSKATVPQPSQEYVANRAGILLVDDDDDVRNLIKFMLEDAGYRVYSVESGKAAISFFRENNELIDLLVSDVVMPVMDGNEVYEKLKKLRPGLPVVFVSGYSSNILKHVDNAENVKFLAKPLIQRNLVDTVQAALQSETFIG